MNTNDIYTIDNCTAMGEAKKKNLSALPKVKYFRVQSRGMIGKMDARKDRSVGAWAVLVALEGGNGLRLVTDVAYEYGMIIKGEFKTKEEAFEAAMKIKNTWGCGKSVKNPGVSAEFQKLVAGLKAAGFTDEQIEALKKVA